MIELNETVIIKMEDKSLMPVRCAIVRFDGFQNYLFVIHQHINITDAPHYVVTHVRSGAKIFDTYEGYSTPEKAYEAGRRLLNKHGLTKVQNAIKELLQKQIETPCLNSY